MTYNPYAEHPGYAAPPHPQKTTILVLGILSLVCCGFLGIPAIVMGRRALREIDAGRYAMTDRGVVQAGFICGIIGTAITAAVVVFYAFAAFIAVASGS
ncbi:MAG: DUF4190 domain-containing protein [Nocardioides sp.]|nr:DUF4190 domain-containing protein [Nocardioidaceae bacterium]MCB8958461.1 DUF4190 domain-containing protein [Nocardioides sp.]